MSSENVTSSPHDNEASVVFSKDGAIGHILLNRPKALNALDLPMVDAITAKLRAWETDPTVAVVVIEGAGEKAFCAGGDIRGLYDARQRDDEELLDAFYRRVLPFSLSRRSRNVSWPDGRADQSGRLHLCGFGYASNTK